MLSEFALEGVGALEGIGSGNLHFPAVTALRGEDDDSPVAVPIGKDVLDPRDHVALRFGVAGIVQFDRYGHSQSLRHSGMDFSVAILSRTRQRSLRDIHKGN